MPRKRKKPYTYVSKPAVSKFAPKRIRRPRRPTPPPLPTQFFVMSSNAPRAIPGVADCPKGVWVKVPKHIYDGYVIAIEQGKIDGNDVGWKVRCE